VAGFVARPGLPMLRIVIPTSSPYPKPFKQQTSFAVWLF